MKRIFIILLPVIVTLFACEKKLDIDLPESEKNIVVNSLINPDSVIEVHVSRSQDILDTNEGLVYLPDATVKLYNNNEFIETLNYMDSGQFVSAIYPEIGNTYKIEVESSGLNSVYAETELLEPTKILSVDTVIEFEIYEYEYEPGMIMADTLFIVHFEIEIDDINKADNFYFLSISLLNEIYDENFELIDTRESPVYFETSNPAFKVDNNFLLNGMQGFVFSDELFNGNIYNVDVSSYISKYDFAFDPESIFFSQPVKIFVRLLTVSEDIYKYITSSNLNQQSEFDPFSQPVQIFSNIENGLGLFSAYTLHVDSLDIDF